MLQYWKCRRNTIQSALDLQKSSKKKRNKKRTRPTHTTHFFFFFFFFLRQHEFAGSYDWHRATIKRPMESSQWQSGKYSTRRVMLGTCWDIDFVPGWSYRTDRVSAFLARRRTAFWFLCNSSGDSYTTVVPILFFFFFYQYDHDT